MKKLTLILFFFISFSLFAQENCLKTSKDQSGVITKETKFGKLSTVTTKVFGVYLNKINSDFNIRVLYRNGNKDHYFVAKGHEYILILNDNSKIVLYANNDYEANIENTGTKNQTFTLNATYKIEKQQLETIKKVGIKHIKIYFEDKCIEEDLSIANNTTISQLISCLLSK